MFTDPKWWWLIKFKRPLMRSLRGVAIASKEYEPVETTVKQKLHVLLHSQITHVNSWDKKKI